MTFSFNLHYVIVNCHVSVFVCYLKCHGNRPPPHPSPPLHTHTKQNISHLDIIWHEFVKYIIYSLKQIVFWPV